MTYVFDKDAFQPSAEINSLQKGIDVKNKEGVEIFCAICNGKDLTKYGDKVDKVMKYMKNLGEKALAGDLRAQAEINAIREIQIQTPLLQRINLFNYMGDFHSVGFNEELRWKVRQLQGKMSGEQASSGSFAFPTQVWREGSMPTKTISGGLAIDYREVASMNTQSLADASNQVVTDMMNQMFYNVVFNMYNSIRNAWVLPDGLTAFSEAAGLNQAAVDTAIRLIRRWGNVTISGDYSVISQLEAFAAFNTIIAGQPSTQFSEAVMEEIRKTGLLKMYRSCPVVEIPNTYNVTKVNQTAGIAGTPYFDTYLPEGLLFILPKMNTGSPLQVGIKGGVATMSGQDINLSLQVQRFDIEWGSIVIPELIPLCGLISDSNFVVDKR